MREGRNWRRDGERERGVAERPRRGLLFVDFKFPFSADRGDDLVHVTRTRTRFSPTILSELPYFASLSWFTQLPTRSGTKLFYDAIRFERCLYASFGAPKKCK